MIHPLVAALIECCVAVGAVQGERMPLTRGTQAACRIVAVCDQPTDRLMEMAVRAVADPVKRWSGADLPVVRVAYQTKLEAAGQALGAPAIVLATLDQLRRIAPETIEEQELLLRVESLDDQAYVCLPIEERGTRLLLVVGKTLRAVYNGAAYVGEMSIDGQKDQLSVDMSAVVRSPKLRQRPVYLLTIWGEEDEYSADDWMKMFESFARDGVTDVYFWLSGHFPSKKFPQTYKLKDKDWDSTESTRIGTIADQKLLILRAHELGMRFYLGGGLGAWCGSFMLTHREPGTMRKDSHDESGQDVSEWALCPSSDRSREALIAYYKEMYDSLPAADGLYIESADEYGECACERCRRPVDALGSRMFGQNQLSLMQRMMHEIWKDHPQARLCYTIGYPHHKKDPAYYEVVRQMSADDRIEWMEARGSWMFAGPGGEELPPAYFSPRIMRWDYADTRPLENMVANSWRAATSGMSGYISTFSPGFASGSLYHDVPFPTERLPYVLTHFVHREAAWQPTPRVEAMKQRVGRRFFGDGASDELTDSLWKLRSFLPETAKKKISSGQMQVLAQIEASANAAREKASPKMREGLELMTQAIEDVRRLCKVTASSRPH